MSNCVVFLGHSVLSDKSRIASAEAAALTLSKLLASASQNHDLLKKPAVASPCTASLVFSSQSLECRESKILESQADSGILDSNAAAEVSWSDFKCFQAKGEGSYLKGNDRALSAESLKSTQETTQILSNSKIVSEFSGLCKVSERGVLDIRRSEASATFPEKSPQAELLNFNIKDTQ